MVWCKIESECGYSLVVEQKISNLLAGVRFPLPAHKMKTYVFRLKPGQNIREEIEKFVDERDIKAGIILTCVGSLKKAVLRMADAEIIKSYDGIFEIVSLVGTVEKDNSHLHMSISDENGNVFGGHLKNDSVVGTTAEIAIAGLEDIEFKRELDKETGYDELVVNTR